MKQAHIFPRLVNSASVITAMMIVIDPVPARGDQDRLQVIGQYGGASWAIAASANRVYLGIGPRVVILDASDPTHLVVLGRTAVLPYNVAGITIAGDFAYVAAGYGGFAIVDISDPTSPETISTLLQDEYVKASAVAGNYAYVAAASKGLRVVDISDPALPQVVGSHYTAGSAGSVALSSHYAYVTNGSDAALEILDILDPKSPTLAATYDPGDTYTYDVKVSGDILYLASAPGPFEVLDISNPSSPILLGQDPLVGFNSNSIALAGRYACLTGWDEGLKILDVLDSTSPAQVGALTVAGPGVAVAVSGSYAYIATDFAGLAVVDISDPAAPALVSEFEANLYAFGVVTDGQYAYVADGYYDDGLQVIDISDPAGAVRVGCSLPDEYYTNGYDHRVPMARVGSHVYMAGRNGALRIFDVSDPNAPSLAGSFAADAISSITAEGNYIYLLGAPDDALEVVDVSNAASPVSVGRHDITENPYAVYLDSVLASGYLYIADGVSGVVVIDVTDPLAPQRVGAWTLAFTRAISGYGNYVYAAEHGVGVHVLDVSIPQLPVQAGLFAQEYSAIALSAGPQFVFTCDVGVSVYANSGLVSDPPVGRSLSRALTNSVVSLGDVALASENWAGLVILQMTPPPASLFSLDIKPGSCPNPLNWKSRGLIPVSLIAYPGADAAEIDQASIRLSRADGEGGSVAPLASSLDSSVIEDVSAPSANEDCQCGISEPDGKLDLSIKFSVQELVESFGLADAAPRETVELLLSARLDDGTVINARDCLTIVPAADFDVDLDVDQLDLSHFQRCLSGSEIGRGELVCEVADLDSDGDVDQTDFGLFQRCLGEAPGSIIANCEN